MQKVATHIVEIDNGQLISWRGHYQDYLKHKQASLEAQAKAEALFDKKLAQEETWIRQGIKARRTRNEGRVRALEHMRLERQNRRVRKGHVNLTQQRLELAGKVVFEVDNISYRYQSSSEDIIKNFSTLIMRGDKVGLIGANGSGKSTLLNLLLGKLKPDNGIINVGTKLTIGYFDQNRSDLDENKTVMDNICEGSETITIGNTTKHIIGYCQDFLFSPARARCLVKSLSGGEQNRVILAKLLSKPCNLLVLDEPTNDLDIETLELLEEQLLNYKGTLLLVSHDRAFLNNVVTNTLVMEGSGHVGDYVGGYNDWLRQRKQKQITDKKSSSAKSKQQTQPPSPEKLGYQQQRELAALPAKIEKLEQQQTELQTKLSDQDFYKNHKDEVAGINKQLQQIEMELGKAYARWTELES